LIFLSCGSMWRGCLILFDISRSLGDWFLVRHYC
jgi:hypothetical protein